MLLIILVIQMQHMADVALDFGSSFWTQVENKWVDGDLNLGS